MTFTLSYLTFLCTASYPYVSHLMCNAGIAPFISINWPSCIHQLLTDPLGAVTSPIYYLQTWGEVSQDGYGFTWQCNVFGHYTLVRRTLFVVSDTLTRIASTKIYTICFPLPSTVMIHASFGPLLWNRRKLIVRKTGNSKKHTIRMARRSTKSS